MDDLLGVHEEEHRYGPGARNTLDLYTPVGGSTGRVLVWVHGGAWVDRSKAEFAGLGRGLVRAGAGRLSVAVVNYHLSPRSLPPTVTFPSHVRDVARALNW
jgi:acetyl esterase/lipase